jgi:hypothetical protein
MGSMNQMNPLNHINQINVSSQMQQQSPMNQLHHSGINYYPLYHSGIGPHQPHPVA